MPPPRPVTPPPPPPTTPPPTPGQTLRSPSRKKSAVARRAPAPPSPRPSPSVLTVCAPTTTSPGGLFFKRPTRRPRRGGESDHSPSLPLSLFRLSLFFSLPPPSLHSPSDEAPLPAFPSPRSRLGACRRCPASRRRPAASVLPSHTSPVAVRPTSDPSPPLRRPPDRARTHHPHPPRLSQRTDARGGVAALPRLRRPRPAVARDRRREEGAESTRRADGGRGEAGRPGPPHRPSVDDEGAHQAGRRPHPDVRDARGKGAGPHRRAGPGGRGGLPHGVQLEPRGGALDAKPGGQDDSGIVGRDEARLRDSGERHLAPGARRAPTTPAEAPPRSTAASSTPPSPCASIRPSTLSSRP